MENLEYTMVVYKDHTREFYPKPLINCINEEKRQDFVKQFKAIDKETYEKYIKILQQKND